MSLTELTLVVGLWAIWMALLLTVLRGLGRADRPNRAQRSHPPSRAPWAHLS